MTASTGNNKGYTAADIERYHAGQMSASEMHALEKAAMDDPFLADALEGFRYTATASQDLQQLQARLHEKTGQTKKVVPLFRRYYWLRVAAIILFVAGGGWLIYKTTAPSGNSIAIKTGAKENNAAAQDTAVNSTDTALVQQQQGALETNVFTATPDSMQVSEDDKSVAAKGNHAGHTRAIENLTSNAMAAPSGLSNQSSRWSPARNNQAVANRISAPAYQLPDSSKADSLQQDMALMLHDTEAARHDTVKNMNIVLQPNNEGMPGVVVLSKGKTENAKAMRADIKVDSLEPTIGWAGFDEYIANNIKIPDDLRTKEPISGEVELSFDISKSGEPVNIAVVRSLCNKCDQEAIRLLKEGPRWKKKKNKKGTVVIHF